MEVLNTALYHTKVCLGFSSKHEKVDIPEILKKPINKIKGRHMTERDIALSIPFDKTLGYTCPKCLSVGIGAKWAQGTNYCPKCGQKIKLIEKRDWPLILKDAEKIPDVTETNIVTTATDFSEGLSSAKKYINGVYMERLKAYNDKNAQIEGQMSIFDY